MPLHPDAMADRGDLIGCTVMFEMAEKGKVPISFTLNGRPITQKSIFIEFYQDDLSLFPFVSMGYERVLITAKVGNFAPRLRGWIMSVCALNILGNRIV